MGSTEQRFSDTLTSFMSYEEVKRRYVSSKTKFRIARLDYDTCRSWCSKGGVWPSRTRIAKANMAKRARSCRHWQVLYENLRNARKAAMPAL